MEKTFEDDNTYPLFNNCTWRMPMLKYRNIYLFFTKKKLVLTNHRLYNWLTVTLQSFSGWDACCLVVTIFCSVPSFARIYLLLKTIYCLGVYTSISWFNPKIPPAHRSVENGTLHSGSQLSRNVLVSLRSRKRIIGVYANHATCVCLPESAIRNQRGTHWRRVGKQLPVTVKSILSNDNTVHLSGWQEI